MYYECTADLHFEMKRNIWLYYPLIFGIHKSGVEYFKPQNEDHVSIYGIITSEIQELCTIEMLDLIYRESHFTDHVVLKDESCIDSV